MMSLFYRRHRGRWHGESLWDSPLFFGVETPPPVYQHSSPPPYFALRSAVYPFQPKAGVWSACPAFQPCGWWSGLLNVTPDITRSCRGGFQPYSELTHARGVNIHAKNLSAHVCLRTAPSVLKKFGWRNILVLNWQETVRKINAIINERWLWN